MYHFVVFLLLNLFIFINLLADNRQSFLFKNFKQPVIAYVTIQNELTKIRVYKLDLNKN